MTVQNVRSAGASDIIVNTVTGAPAKFYGSMGAPHTFIDPATGETITIISEATAVDFAGHLDSGKVVIDAIAPGYVDTRGSLVGDIVVIRPVTEWVNNIFNILSEAHNDDGTLKPAAIVYEPTSADFIQTGGTWTVTTGLSAAMTALVGYQAGFRGTVSAIAARAYTLSKDTYVDVLRNSTTNAFSIVYTEVANGAAAPALAANSIRLAKVVTSGVAVTSIVQVGSDSLSNVIYPAGTYQVFSVVRQDAVTNDTKKKNIMVTGWGYVPYNTGAPNVTNVVVLPVKFLVRPIVTAVFGGDHPSLTTYGSGGNSVEGVIVLKAHTIDVDRFTIQLHKPSGANFATGYGFYQWCVIGEVLA